MNTTQTMLDAPISLIVYQLVSHPNLSWQLSTIKLQRILILSYLISCIWPLRCIVGVLQSKILFPSTIDVPSLKVRFEENKFKVRHQRICGPTKDCACVIERERERGRTRRKWITNLKSTGYNVIVLKVFWTTKWQKCKLPLCKNNKVQSKK